MPAHPPTSPDTPPTIHLNWQDWLPYLEESQASEAEKKLLIETVWNIVLAFADLGWDIDPAEENSGKSLDLTAALRAAVLNSKHTHKEQEEA